MAEITLDEIRNGLEALTNLRNSVLEENDVVGRLFKPMLKKPGPTRDDLDKAVETFEARVPGLYVWFDAGQGVYGLFPYLG